MEITTRSGSLVDAFGLPASRPIGLTWTRKSSLFAPPLIRMSHWVELSRGEPVPVSVARQELRFKINVAGKFAGGDLV